MLDVRGVDTVGERVVQFGIPEAAFVMGGGQRKESGLTAAELEEGWPGHQGEFVGSGGNWGPPLMRGERRPLTDQIVSSSACLRRARSGAPQAGHKTPQPRLPFHFRGRCRESPSSDTRC